MSDPMSALKDVSNPLGVRGLIGTRSIGVQGLIGGNQLTDYERQLQPFFQTEETKQEQERNWLKPVQWIFDRLQTGQYISANVADWLIKTMQGQSDAERGTLLSAIADGITGRRKGTYETILRDTLGVGTKKLFGNSPEGTRRAQIDWADVLGFVGDVLLDPLTYMTFGVSPVTKATKGASKAASEFADDAVRLAMRQISQNPEQFAKLAKGNLGAIEAAATGASKQDIAKLLQKGSDLGRFMDITYREAYVRGLNRTQQELVKYTQEALSGVTDTKGLEGIVKRVSGGSAYEKAGEMFKARVFGNELGKAPAEGLQKTINTNYERFTRLMRGNPDSSGVRSAIWAVLNRGPVGDVKRLFGVRNPYQKYLRSIELEQGQVYAQRAANEEAKRAIQAIGSADETHMNEVIDYIAKREAFSRNVPKNAPAWQSFSGIEAKPEVVDSAYKLKTIFDDWQASEAKWATDLGEDPSNYYDWYLPEVFRFRETKSPNVARGRKYTFTEQVEKEKNLLKFVFGVDNDLATRIVKQNASGLSYDLREMVTTRALTHARIQARHNMITTFREFGLNLEDYAKQFKNGLATSGRDITALGMKQIDHPALDGYVFDYDVADIFSRALKVTGQDRNIIQSSIATYANWWKSMVTLTTGFHARNFMSNAITQFLRHGTHAFGFESNMQALAGVFYALKQVNPEKFFENGFDQNIMNKYLNQRIGEYTIKELADEALQRGVISESTMAFEAKTLIEKVTKTGKKQPLRNLSRTAGSYIENIPRFQSFLIDFKDLASSVADQVARREADSVSMDWAGRQAKKWFLDYQDLCFDTETEILTSNGWRTIDTISYRDKVLSFNIKEDCLEWKQIDYIHRAGYNGKMFHMKNNTFDAMVTPRHRWVRFFGVNGGHYSIPKAKYTIEETQNIVNKNTTLKITSSKYKAPENETFSLDFVELCAWSLSEGTYGKKDRAVTIYQSHTHNPQYCEQIIELFGRLGGQGSLIIRPHNKEITAFCVGKGLGEKIRDWFPDKRPTIEFLQLLTNEQLEVFYLTLLKADGHKITYETGGEHWVFSQKDPEFVAMFQALAMMIGRRTVAREINGYYQIGCHRKDTKMYIKALTITEKSYSGRIWSVHSENNTVVARRNNTIYISGNTDFEQKTMKSIIPFYSWMRKNLANQINGVLLYPELYSLLPKIEDLIAYEDPAYDPGLLPEWLKDAGAFAVRNPEAGMYRVFRPDFAHMDLNILPFHWEEGQLFPKWDGKTIKDNLINATAPWIKEIASRMTENGYNYFYKEDLAPTADAPYLFRMFASRPGTISFIDGLMRSIGFEDGAKLSLKDGKLQMDGQMANSLEQFLPVLRQAEFLFYLPEVAFPGLAETIENVTNAQPDYQGAEQSMQLMSYYLGIKTKDVDLQREKQRIGWDIYYKAQEALSEARKQMHGYEQRSMNARQRTARSIRRLGGV